MDEIKAIFGILSSLVVVIGGIPYLVDIHKKRVHPHVLSWIGWAFITALGASAMLAEGSTWAVAILLANTLLCVSISVYAVIKKVGVWSTGIHDFIFFGLGILGLVLWQTLDLPILAIVCAILADLFFGLPTIIKTFKDPASETIFVWLTASVSGLLSLFAVRNFMFAEAGYPLYLLIYDTIMLLLVLRVISSRKVRQEAGHM